MLIKNWDEMDFWQSGEWQVVEELLDDLDKQKILYNPDRENLFASLDATPFDKTKVMLCGQDPYPNHDLCTGLAFSIPKGKPIPPTLDMIFDEYETDLHYPRPTHGNLTEWADQGVLLWNAYPTCLAGKSLSHMWSEWDQLSAEITRRLDERGVVFCFLGGIAGNLDKHIDPIGPSFVLKASHPSPRGNRHSRTPFIGSRIFTSINDKLCALGHEPINWRL